MPRTDRASSFCILVSGLPASGKSTTGRRVADALNLAFLDKDDILERLFRERGTGDANWRQALSRESDGLFQREAAGLEQAVLVSHWRPPGSDSQSGTPVEWVFETFSMVIEVYCACPVEVATDRFTERVRHPGHIDGRRSPEEVFEWLDGCQRDLPLLEDGVERIDTSGDLLMGEIIHRLRRRIDRHSVASVMLEY